MASLDQIKKSVDASNARIALAKGFVVRVTTKGSYPAAGIYNVLARREDAEKEADRLRSLYGVKVTVSKT